MWEQNVEPVKYLKTEHVLYNQRAEQNRTKSDMTTNVFKSGNYYYMLLKHNYATTLGCFQGCVLVCVLLCVAVYLPDLLPLRESRLALWEETPLDKPTVAVSGGADKNQQTCKLTWTGSKLQSTGRTFSQAQESGVTDLDQKRATKTSQWQNVHHRLVSLDWHVCANLKSSSERLKTLTVDTVLTE